MEWFGTIRMRQILTPLESMVCSGLVGKTDPPLAIVTPEKVKENIFMIWNFYL